MGQCTKLIILFLNKICTYIHTLYILTYTHRADRTNLILIIYSSPVMNIIFQNVPPPSLSVILCGTPLLVPRFFPHLGFFRHVQLCETSWDMTSIIQYSGRILAYDAVGLGLTPRRKLKYFFHCCIRFSTMGARVRSLARESYFFLGDGRGGGEREEAQRSVLRGKRRYCDKT